MVESKMFKTLGVVLALTIPIKSSEIQPFTIQCKSILTKYEGSAAQPVMPQFEMDTDRKIGMKAKVVGVYYSSDRSGEFGRYQVLLTDGNDNPTMYGDYIGTRNKAYRREISDEGDNSEIIDNPDYRGKTIREIYVDNQASIMQSEGGKTKCEEGIRIFPNYFDIPPNYDHQDPTDPNLN